MNIVAVRRNRKWTITTMIHGEIEKFIGKTFGEAIRLVERALEKANG